MWILIALIAPTCYGIACVFDSFLINKNFKNPLTIAFFSSLLNIIFVPFLFLFDKPIIPPITLIPIFILLGIINISYLYPYFRGLQNDDTSTVVAFFGIGRIFIPILAFLIAGEILSLYQYVGIILIILSVLSLSIKRIPKGFIFKKAFIYIICAAFITSFEGVLLKYLFNHGIPVSTAIGGELIMSLFLVFLFLLPKSLRKDIQTNISTFKKNIHIFFTEELFTFLAFVAEGYAIHIAPVSLVKGITIFTPFFILLYSNLFGKRFPNTFKEEKNIRSNIKKILLFTSLSVGVFLITS